VVVVAVITVAFTIAGGTPLGQTQQVENVTQRISSVGYSAQGVDPRLQIWEVTPLIVADHPVFGVSANGFADVAPRYGLIAPFRSATYLHAHNIPLTIAAELGLFGLAALAWLVVAVVRVLIAAYRRADRSNRGIMLAVTAALTAAAAQGMVDYTLRSNAIVGAVMVMLGCAVVLSKRQPARAADATGSARERRPGTPGPLASASQRPAAVQ